MLMQIAARQSSDTNRGRDIHMIVGIAECGPGEIVEERISTYAFKPQPGGGYSLTDTGIRTAVDDWSMPKYDDVANLVRNSVWPVPTTGEYALLFFRRSVAEPMVPGNVSLVFSGLILTAPEHAPHVEPTAISVLAGSGTMHSMGRLGIEVLPDREIPDMVEATHGENLTSFLRMPLWGFGPEPVSYPSTMHLHSIAGFSRIMELQLREDLSGDESTELSDLRREVGLMNPDPVYIQTLKAMVRQNPGIDLPGRITRVQTASQVAVSGKQMKRALVGGLIGDDKLLPDEPEAPAFR